MNRLGLRAFFTLLVPVLLVACEPEEPTPTATPFPLSPVAQISSPADGEIIYPARQPWQFIGNVSDPDDDDWTRLVSSFHIYSGAAEVATAEVLPDFAGNVRWEGPFLNEGDYRLRLETRDPGGRDAVKEITFSIRNQAPTVTILSPVGVTELDQGVPITVSAQFADPDHPVGQAMNALLLANGFQVSQQITDASWFVTFSYTPGVEGPLTLTVKAEDQYKAVGEASLSLTIRPCYDADLDGFYQCARDGQPADCDDGDPLIKPGAEEACDLADTDCDGNTPDEESDFDGDGQPPCQGDCDDLDIATYDGALERCDGVDNDCNGELPTTELDEDLDGYRGCSANGVGADCNDLAAAIHPGLTEICDGADTNCDGSMLAEEADADRDGYMLCEQDCDDTNAYTYPGATERLDFTDNDCDGRAEGALRFSAAQARLSATQVDANAGASLSIGTDFSGDGVGDLVVGAPRYNASTSSGANRGSAFLVFGRVEGWKSAEGTTFSRFPALYSTETNSRLGTAVSAVGDMNGDKIGDLLIGAPGHTANSQTEAGVAWLVAGRKDWANAEIESVSLTGVEGNSSGMLVGQALSQGGDVSGDGVMDVAIGVPWTTRRPSAPGTVAILSARSFGWTAKTAINSIPRIAGVDSTAIGTALAVGDTTGDAFDELLVGGLGVTSTSVGIVYWIPGSASLKGASQTTVTNLNARYYQGDTSSEKVGSTVATGVDVDGDGAHDALVGRSTDGATGDAAAYLLFGSNSLPISGVLEKVANVRFMRSALDECPCAVAALSDFDGDGFGDVAISASRSNASSNDAGAVYLFLGRARSEWPPTLSLEDADGVIYGEADRDQVGVVLASGDLNNDGATDLAVGAPFASGIDEKGVTYAGAGRVYVLLGSK